MAGLWQPRTGDRECVCCVLGVYSMTMAFTYDVFVFLVFLATATSVPFVPGGHDVSPLPQPASCCFNDSVVSHGDVVLAFPSKCLQLVCSHGEIKPHYLGQPGSKDCCEFDGLLYPEGAQLSAQCLAIKCYQGQWNPSSLIEDCCRHCCLHDDPHIYTFDDYQYDWHGTCNYSVAQTDHTFYPEAAIFSDFQPCNGRASCLQHTTFRDNPHTIISLDNADVFTMLVNGDPYVVAETGVEAVRSSGRVHSVLAWRNGHCAMLLGSSRLMLQHCRYRLDVWAHPSHADNLNGLCGHYNFYREDDFTDREGEVHHLQYWPSIFPNSWLTPDQNDYVCKDKCPTCHVDNVVDPCLADADQRAAYRAQCQHHFQSVLDTNEKLHTHLRTCEFDLCMMYQDGRTDQQTKEWLSFLLVNLKTSSTIIQYTLEGAKVQVPEDLLNITLDSCGCVVIIRPELTSVEEQLPRLLESLQELHYAVQKFGPLESFTVVKPRGLLGFFKVVVGMAKKILGYLKAIWNEGRSGARSERFCPLHSLKTARHDIAQVTDKVQKIKSSLKRDDPLLQEVQLNIQETIDTVDSAVSIVTEIKIKLESTPCY
ncbi:LOW QUALITY PROTEIN: mucin-2-like [Panulirus ornatus]|uniref:LOW QUALITY PROTEIN: mucin-2-like n=1 Tax=Panulirus ornatus TaxID=150431 RepID=UPI003A84A7B9